VRDRTLCAAIEPDELELINAIVTKTDHLPEVTIFAEGESSDNIYNVTRGVVRISKLLPDGRRQITGFMFPGDLLGLAHGDSFVYTAESVTPVSLCRLPRRKLEVLFKRVPNLERRLFAVTAHELAAAQDQMLLLGRKSAREKLSTFLLTMQDRARQRGQTDNPIELAMSWADIADYLGMSHEHVSRTLRELVEDGNLKRLAKRRLVIVRGDALRDMAEGADEP
jgi:CRP/FNR family transcriptional regulator